MAQETCAACGSVFESKEALQGHGRAEHQPQQRPPEQQQTQAQQQQQQ